MPPRMLESRIAGLVISGIAYVVAFAVAVLVVRVLPLEHPLAQTGVGTVVATLVVFVISVLADNSSIYDPYWSVQPLALAGVYIWWSGSQIGAREVVVTVLIFLYSLRLTANFYRGWSGLTQEDFRYRDFRTRFGRAYWPVSLFGIHLFPTGMVWLGCLPLYAVMDASAGGIGWLDVAAAAVFLAAVGLAFTADEQLRVFREDPANRGTYIRRGLWSSCRHPNYLGEMTAWWGLWLFALAAGLDHWWTGVGATAITLMFVFVSVPMMEGRTRATKQGYDEYMATTPMLLPVPRRSLRERHADRG